MKFIALSALSCALIAPSAHARLITFDELADGSISVTIDALAPRIKPNAESYRLCVPSLGTTNGCDSTISLIGISFTADFYLFNILESAGGPLSDQVYVHRIPGACANGFCTVIDFISDPAQFINLQANATVVETGAVQSVGSYISDDAGTVQLRIRSDIDVPLPSTIALLGIGMAGIGVSRRKKS